MSNRKSHHNRRRDQHSGSQDQRQRHADLQHREAELDQRAAGIVKSSATATQPAAHTSDSAAPPDPGSTVVLAQSARAQEDKLAELEERYRRRTIELEQALTARSEGARRTLDAELAQRRARVEAELSAARSELEAGLDTLARERESHHKQRVQALDSLAKRRLAAEKELDELSATHAAGLADRLAAGHADLAKLKADVESAQLRLMSERQQIGLDQAARIRDAQAPLELANANLNAELGQVRSNYQYGLRRLEMLEKENDRLQSLWQGLEAEKPEEVIALIGGLRAAIKKKDEELAYRATREQTRQLEKLQAELMEAQRANDQLVAKCDQLEHVINRDRVAANRLEGLRSEAESLSGQVRILEGIIARQQKAYDDLDARTSVKAKESRRITRPSDEYSRRTGDIDEPLLTFRESSQQEWSETDWLDAIEAAIHKCGMHYPRRLLESFHTCLKIAEWAPLTVLSGVSGTGKSELPRLYARFGGLYFDSLAVQPNWDSPQDLFGFFNYMDSRFTARPLLRKIAQSQKKARDGGFADQLLLVLLDEMNLAKVELYLSDLLSKWELRRGEGEVLLDFDLGPDCDRYSVPLGRNVLFVGTINEDESTQSLSDKVLDRGNLLYFPRPKSLLSRSTLDLVSPAAPLPHESWRDWIRRPPSLENSAGAATAPKAAAGATDTNPETAKLCTHYRGVVNRINELLGGVERALGHRVWQAIELYLVNHPKVLAAGADRDRLAKAFGRAFEDQVVQRIVPKLRGLETGDAGEAGQTLRDLGQEIERSANGLTNDFHAALRSSHGTFTWRQSTYIDAS